MSSLGKQLMALISQEGLIIAERVDLGMYVGHGAATWNWLDEEKAETKINEFMDKHLTKAVRKEVCRQLLAVVDNIQELPEP